jgi:hypothetical protein
LGHRNPGSVILDWEIDRASYHAVPIMSDGTLGPPLALRALFEQYIRNRAAASQQIARAGFPE